MNRIDLKIISWNLGHQTNEAPIRSALTSALEVLRPDILVLNEFVDGVTRSTLRASLEKLGLSHSETSRRVGRHNQVFIASKWPLSAGELVGPAMPGGAGESNFLHVHLPKSALEIVGLRAPAYKTQLEQHQYWAQLSALIRPTGNRRIVWIGDLNANPDEPSHVGGKYLATLRQEGWKLPRASGAWSFVKGTRIDHVVASAAVEITSAEYVSDINGVAVASHDTTTRVSDHAALVATITDVDRAPEHQLEPRASQN